MYKQPMPGCLGKTYQNRNASLVATTNSLTPVIRNSQCCASFHTDIHIGSYFHLMQKKYLRYIMKTFSFLNGDIHDSMSFFLRILCYN